MGLRDGAIGDVEIDDRGLGVGGWELGVGEAEEAIGRAAEKLRSGNEVESLRASSGSELSTPNSKLPTVFYVPSLRSFSTKVVRLRPRRAAASVRLPSARSRAASMRRRSTSSRRARRLRVSAT